MLYPQNNAHRITWQLDGVWDFCIDPEGQGKSLGYPQGIPKGRKLAVPASWNEQSNDLYHYDKIGWYEKLFFIPVSTENKRVVLRFSSVEYRANVYVNGQFVGENTVARLPFEYDITDFIKIGEANRLVLEVDGGMISDWIIGSGDFYSYSGISRPVFISIVADAYIKDISAITTLGEHGGVLDLSAFCTGGSRIVAQVNGVTVEECIEDGKGKAQFEVPNITPWSCETPALYPLTLQLYDGESIVDSYILKLGFREVKVEGRKVLLNGKPIYFKGFGKHEDFHIIGKGLSNALNVRDFDLMRWIGANSFRTSHYPYSEEVLDLTDELGILVINEAPFVSFEKNVFESEKAKACAPDVMQLFIERDRNHPSVISWSVGNETKSALDIAEDFFVPIINRAKEIDPTRPITYVAWTKPEEDKVYKHVDIIGLNRYYGWYPYPEWSPTAEQGDIGQGVRAMEKCLDHFAELYDQPLIVTEFGVDTIAGFHSTFMLQFSEEFQTRFLVEYIKLIMSKDYMAGMHIWNFADFATGQNVRRVMGNKKGLFTRERAPKSAAFAVRKLWNDNEEDGLYALNDVVAKKENGWIMPGT